MSASSFSDMGGRVVVAPGRLTPLRSPSAPSLRTSHSTSTPDGDTLLTTRLTRPSSNSTTDPAATVRARSSYATYSRSASPSPSYCLSVVSVTVAPVLSSILAFRSPVSRHTRSPPHRISGPLVSSMVARRLNDSCGTCMVPCRPLAVFRCFIRSSTSSGVAWLKFTRITRIPASTTACSVSWSSEAGPIVATILASWGRRRTAVLSARRARVGSALMVGIGLGRVCEQATHAEPASRRRTPRTLQSSISAVADGAAPEGLPVAATAAVA